MGLNFIFGRLAFRYIAIRAMNCVVASIVIPIATFRNSVPFHLCALKGYTCKLITIIERIPDTRYAVWYRYAR